jgi:fused signal recognition particle receptor
MAKVLFAEKLKNLFTSKKIIPDSFFDDLTDALIEGDVGAKTAYEIGDTLRKSCRENHRETEEAVRAELRTILSAGIRQVSFMPENGKVSIYMLFGVNGVGKTTTAAKLASYYRSRGIDPVILAAADTFRAAAEEQLEMHGTRLGIRVVSHQHGSDPSSVVYDAADAAAAAGGALVIADTAGRLHNKDNLVHELQKIDRIAAQKAAPGCYRKLLVLDATTGQNALRQAEVFSQAIGLDGVILTKYDSTAKGGIAITLGRELSVPLVFVCTGEHYEDMKPFDASEYIDDFLGQ